MNIFFQAAFEEGLRAYIASLQTGDSPYAFIPCRQGLTPVGQSVALGFSCFALKIYYMLGLWPTLTPVQQQRWLDFIRSFQQSAGATPDISGAYIDPAMVSYLKRSVGWKVKLRRLLPNRQPEYFQQVILAETKQAIATLAQVGADSPLPFRGFPSRPAALRDRLTALDWRQPWAAGGQASALAVFAQVEATRFLPAAEASALQDICGQVFEAVADRQTGGYFKGTAPDYGQLINGSMKVLTGLDWLERPIHYPKALIDTCLSQMPKAEGCHLVDAVYVLYRCAQQTDHRRMDIQDYCRAVLALIDQHLNPDGGFSYFVGRSQTHYYSVPIAQGAAVSDIHGTCLMVWALAMLFELLNVETRRWHVIKP
ncbi:MAG: hypothetical protein AAFU71_05695 [Cyanobacteria bacterium J06632_22]